jgi:hypothetical protein
MKLLTKTVEKSLPALYSQEDNPDPKVVLHFFNPMGAGDWHITEGQAEDEDFIFFGLCDLGMGYPELGYVSLNELESVKLPFGLGIERDLHWRVKPLSEVMR